MLAWKAILAALVIFVAGVASGVMGVVLYRTQTQPQPPRMPGGPPSPWLSQRMDFMRRMGDRLELTEEQRKRIDEILRASQQRSRDLWEPLAPKFKEEMEQTKKLIDAELTPEQRQKAEIIQKERFSGPPGQRPQNRWRDGDGSRMREWGPGRDHNPGERGGFPPPPGPGPGPGPGGPPEDPNGNPPGTPPPPDAGQAPSPAPDSLPRSE